MEYRPLPHTNLRVSAAAFGGARIGGTIERFEETEALRVLQRAMDAGINFFDTADIYAQGNSERIFAKAFAGKRDQVLLATKGGYRVSTAASFASKLKPLLRRALKLLPGLQKSAQKARASQINQDFSATHLSAALHASLKRLGTDYVDLYQLHSPPPEALKSDEAFAALESFRKAGKVRAFGVSCLRAEDVALCTSAGVTAIQLELSLARPAALQTAVPLALYHGIAVIARQPLGSGLLTRSPDTWMVDDFGGDEHALQSTRARMEKLRALGEPTDIALRWLLHRKGIHSVLFATTRMAHLEKNLRAFAAPALAADEIALVESTLS